MHPKVPHQITADFNAYDKEEKSRKKTHSAF